MPLPFKQTVLWRQPDFVKLWTGQTISLFGSAITILALPLTAISILHADAQQMGFLFALSQMPPLLFGLVIGAWVDRVHRRPLLMIADLGRAVLLALIPFIYHIHKISLRQVITSDKMQGRVNATMQVISWATTPIGSLLGGWLGENIGLRPTLFVVAGGLLLAQPWLLFSPLRTLRTLPTTIENTVVPSNPS